jgi:hypothetical protein
MLGILEGKGGGNNLNYQRENTGKPVLCFLLPPYQK